MSEKHIGEVVQVIGPVLDIRFGHDELPALLNAIEIDHEGTKLTAEVAQQIGDNTVRCIAMNSTDGLVRGTKAVDTGEPIKVPVGSNWNLDGFTSIYSLGSSYQTIGGIHGDTAYRIIPDLLSNLCCELCAFMINFDGIEKCRQLVMTKPDIQYRSDYLHHLANVFFAHLAVSL